jgi:hypothetical protein
MRVDASLKGLTIILKYSGIVMSTKVTSVFKWPLFRAPITMGMQGTHAVMFCRDYILLNGWPTKVLHRVRDCQGIYIMKIRPSRISPSSLVNSQEREIIL